VTYEGVSDPGLDSHNVLFNCPYIYEVNVPDNYQNEQFCGLPIAKGHGLNQASIIVISVFSVIIAVVIVAAIILVVRYFKRQVPDAQTSELKNEIIP
jgi:heme/copper-type cytochrome/quinol oxidase subunit 2